MNSQLTQETAEEFKARYDAEREYEAAQLKENGLTGAEVWSASEIPFDVALEVVKREMEKTLALVAIPTKTFLPSVEFSLIRWGNGQAEARWRIVKDICNVEAMGPTLEIALANIPTEESIRAKAIESARTAVESARTAVESARAKKLEAEATLAHLLARGKRILAAAEEKNFAAVFGENTDSTVSDSLTRAQAVESELNSKIQSDADARRSFAEGGR